MASLVLERLGRTFHARLGEVHALSNLSLQVAAGEFLVLLGPSGSGKTTTLRLIAGLDLPTAGRVMLDGRDLAGVAPRMRNAAIVFQDYALYPHMTVYRNIAFPLKMRRHSRKEIERAVREAAEIVGVEHLLDRRPAALSGGERQRAALARAMVRRPSLFLLDEPLSSLEPSLRVRLRAELKNLQRRLSATFIYVTHDQEEALALGDSIAVLNAGTLQQCGPPMQLYRQPANRFVATFIGSPAMNFVCATLSRDPSGAAGVSFPWGMARIHAADLVDAASKSAIPIAVEVGVRPEHLTLPDSEHGATASHNGFFVEGIVENIEFLGSLANVLLRLADGVSWLARIPAGSTPAVGTRLACRVQPSDLHLFDRGTGMNIGAI